MFTKQSQLNIFGLQQVQFVIMHSSFHFTLAQAKTQSKLSQTWETAARTGKILKMNLWARQSDTQTQTSRLIKAQSTPPPPHPPPNHLMCPHSWRKHTHQPQRELFSSFRGEKFQEKTRDLKTHTTATHSCNKSSHSLTRKASLLKRNPRFPFSSSLLSMFLHCRMVLISR